ncbi:MAG TPA: alpha-mannosidase [Acidimicrobiia bacterium]|nr:alpha-mannosidase [Acidimicrobiia bacterium]
MADAQRARSRIDHVLKRLVRPAIYGERAPLAVSAFHVRGEPIGVADARRGVYVPFAVGEQWGGAWDTTWFRMRASIPAGWRGSEVVALIDLGGGGMVGFTAEGLVWDDDQPRQGLHLKHREYVVAGPATGGDEIELLIEAAANPIPPWGTTPWPLLMPDVFGPPIYRLGQADLAIAHRDVEALYFDMLVLAQLVDVMGTCEVQGANAFGSLEDACDLIEQGGVAPSTVAAARAELAPVLASRADPEAHRVSAVGNAHIDSAWLWPIRETKRKCARTFANALRLMDDYPEYSFAASQAQQYQWMKEGYPLLYERLRERVRAGRFEPVGSMWVEADCNIPSGESLVRQIVHGKRFFLDELDRETTDLWLPDVFGYSAALPQILKEAGISTFLTQKMSWSEVNRFPHNSFWWEGIDGTRVLTHFPPADTYNGDMSVGELAKADRQHQEARHSNRSLYPFGYGDGGGGPTRAMLESARRLADLDGAPRVEIDTVASFWDKVRAESSDLPVWVGELYLEYHRGTYTTNGPIKRANRRNEQALRAAELWSVAAANLPIGSREYPADALDEAWKLLLLNQFHDIIPGSSIHWANEDCIRDHERIAAVTAGVIANAQQAIASRIDTTGMTSPQVVFNAASQARRELVEIEVDGEQKLVPVDVPACGYVAIDAAAPTRTAPAVAASDRVLENELLRVTWDSDGLLTSVFDKENDREVLAPGARGNLFQLHDDNPKEFDAWNVDIDYLDHRVDLTALTSIAVVENDARRGAVRFVREFGASTITQTMRLACGSHRLDFDTEVDWHERHKFLKVAFPVDVLASRATYEIQFGHLERPTHTNTSWDAARFEVCAHRWADLAEPGYGVALLNDCKYGYDIRGNVMRLSLLRAPGWPDPESDQGAHRFSYALFPHAGDLRTAGVVAEAEAFNVPLEVIVVERGPGRAPTRSSIIGVDRPNVTVEAVKMADREDAVVVRLCEAWGTRGSARVTFDRPVRAAARTDVLEREVGPATIVNGGIELDLRPFELVTLKLTFSS